MLSSPGHAFSVYVAVARSETHASNMHRASGRYLSQWQQIKQLIAWDITYVWGGDVRFKVLVLRRCRVPVEFDVIRSKALDGFCTGHYVGGASTKPSRPY